MKKLSGGSIQYSHPEFQSQDSKDTNELVSLFCNIAVPATPIIDYTKLDAEYRNLERSWGRGITNRGTLLEIADILRRNLERDAKEELFTKFSVSVYPDQYCTQVCSSFKKASGSFESWAKAYRVWHTPDFVFLFHSSDDLE